jgi:hypothetical protein
LRRRDAFKDEEDTPLEGVAAEFRTALKEEIQAARRAAASSAVQLADGRRLSRLGGSHQYEFNIESALQLPDDSPGDLFVPGRAPIEITVVSVEGMRLVLNVAEDLGDFVPNARLQSNMVHLLRRLISRIEDIGSHNNPPGDRLIGSESSNLLSTSVQAAAAGTQGRQAVSATLGYDTAYIWGPPGTGKTFTLGLIGKEIAQGGGSLLLVSHTNTAVDQAVLSIASQLGNELVDGSVIRVGEPRDQQLIERPRLLARTHIEERSQSLVDRRDVIQAERSAAVDGIGELEPKVALGEWTEGAASDIEGLRTRGSELERLRLSLAESRNSVDEASARRTEFSKLAMSAELVASAMARLPELHARREDEAERVAQLSGLLAKRVDELAHARVVLAESQQTGALLRRWRRLPDPEEQGEVVRSLDEEREKGEASLQEAWDLQGGVEQQIAESLGLLADFNRTSGLSSPDEALAQCKDFEESLAELVRQTQTVEREVEKSERTLQVELDDRLRLLRDWGLVQDWTTEVADQIQAVVEALAAARARVPLDELPGMRSQLAGLHAAVALADSELASIEEQLAKVEESVVADAKVVATTLTRAYLRDSIIGRRFDRVMLDEASMAPIPALWAAAQLADRSVAAVGDFYQLPPIHHATHELAEKWLGSDVFDTSGAREGFTSAQQLPWLAALTEQHRMHPSISAIPNAFVYGGRLTDATGTDVDSELDGWYDRDWGHDAPVLLVDTAGANAWVTSVRGTGRSSRLNFLSANVCVDVANRMLRDDRPELMVGDRRRILIGCPYKPHARLLDLLIREQGLAREVGAGTAHSFQGMEASVVLFDLVNDEPHWRVGLFNPSFDESSVRLLNVAITRARKRLVFVGDFDWIRRNAKKAFLGRLVEYLLEKYPLVDAVSILPEGFAARAARRYTVLSPAADDPRDPGSRRIYTQADFLPDLLADLGSARKRVIIYSPFMTTNRLSIMGPHIQGLTARDVEVFVVTKTIGERGKREADEYRRMDRALTEWGAAVVHKYHMHEKLVFVDDDVLWSGSLNVLSFSDTQEVMERRKSKTIAAEYASTLRMSEMLQPYRTGEASCPFCGSELFPAEGSDDPFYWRCPTEGCHTRSIDQPAPRDGVITCANCGSSVHAGEWGGKPHWRCDDNARHRQPMVRTHLRLPTVRSMIPKRQLAKLDRLFGTGPVV